MSLDTSSLSRQKVLPSSPLEALGLAWQERLLKTLSPDLADRIRLQTVMTHQTWKATRNSALTEIEQLNQRTTTDSESSSQSLLFVQHRAKLLADVTALDAAEPQVLQRERYAAGRPQDCTCLGAGGLGRLVCVLGGTPIFERYCDCLEGVTAQAEADIANEETDTLEEKQQAQALARQHHQRTEEMLSRAGISKRYQGINFVTFRAFLARSGALDPKTAEYLDLFQYSYEANEPLRGDYLYGPAGHGKSTLAICMLRAWIERGRVGYFVRVVDLLDKLRASINTHDGVGDVLLDHLKKTPLLVLDDFGMGQGTPYERAKLTSLLFYRHAEGLHTILTSNYSIEEVATLLAGDDNPTERDRIYTRLIEMCDETEWQTKLLRIRDRTP